MKAISRGIGFFLTAVFLSLPGGNPAFADGPVFSGVLESRADFTAGAGDERDFSYGLEEYANLRMRFDIRERAVFYGAFNLIAASGNAARAVIAGGLSGSVHGAGENYAAALELERLYFRVNGSYFDAEAGLMRLAFGYGQVWGSSDFLNPRSPLFPNARRRAILGMVLSAYPSDTARLRGFGSAPKNPLSAGGKGAVFGFSGDQHWDRLSLQGLYAFEVPREESTWGIHRAGLSLKLEAEAGFMADMLYTYDHRANPGIDGLSAGGGFDYSFFDGRFYWLMEYLFNGTHSDTARSPEKAEGLSKRHYLYGMVLYRFTDYTSLSLACTAGLTDCSFSPVVTAEHELFQGCTLSLSGRVPLDRDLFAKNGKTGELGPKQTGTRALIGLLVRLRF
jgi:hypothetical protein